jgi:hypothetical protein
LIRISVGGSMNDADVGVVGAVELFVVAAIRGSGPQVDTEEE